MNLADLLIEVYGRVPEITERAVAGLTPEQLAAAPVTGSNPIGWLGWHLARVQDAQVADVAGTGQVWVEPGWAARFGLEADPADHGYGHSADDVARVRPESAAAITDYLAAVTERTNRYLATLTETDLDQIVDERWDPPVTLGARLVSIVVDDLEHAGQAGYARGQLGA